MVLDRHKLLITNEVYVGLIVQEGRKELVFFVDRNKYNTEYNVTMSCNVRVV